MQYPTCRPCFGGAVGRHVVHVPGGDILCDDKRDQRNPPLEAVYRHVFGPVAAPSR